MNIIPFPRSPLPPAEPGAICIGRRVHSGLYGGRDGIVAAIHGIPSPSTVRTLGDGCIVTGGHAHLDIAFHDQGENSPAHLSRHIPEGIVMGVQWNIYDSIAPAAELEKLLSEIALNEKFAAEVKERATRIHADATRRGQAFLAPRRPAWATHAIVAEHQTDDSDSQTDYFASHTDTTLLLGWSKHGRNLFAEMRKAAANAPETAHLGPECDVYTVFLIWDHDWADETARAQAWTAGHDVYHKGHSLPYHFWSDFLPEQYRESAHYGAPTFTLKAEAEAFIAALPVKAGCIWHMSMESIERYYLGTRMHSGWQVSKVPLGTHDSLAHAVGMGGYRIPEDPGTQPELEPAPDFPPILPPVHIQSESSDPTSDESDPSDHGEAASESTTPPAALVHRTAPIIPARLRDHRARAEATIRSLR